MTLLHSFLRLCAAATIAFVGGVASLPARAQGAEPDPPDRVARLGATTGRVWLSSDEAQEWIEVGRNQPLTTGDRVATAAGARADIALGSTAVRLDADTELEIVQLDDTRFELQLMRGSVAVRLRSNEAIAEFSLVTEEGGFRAETVGRYRFDRRDQASEVTALDGQAVFEGRGSALRVATGQHAQFWLDAAGTPQYSLVAPVRDAFAGWVDERDRADDRVAAVRYVSPEMTGADDLDRYGQWEQSAEYGPLWFPRAVPVGWAPYSTGRWTWVRPWGWTWVDEAPWGFAPFHYGRWVQHRNAWCWAPGTYVARPVYAPALVAWTGTRAGVSINLGGRGAPVGWFPLAPREVYVPSYRSSARHVRNVNFAQFGNVARIDAAIDDQRGGRDRRDFFNRRFPNAVTVVPAGVLTGRQPVGPSAAQYRQDPQVRALVADTRSGSVIAAPPVGAPPRVVRPAADARPSRLPGGDGRGAGGFAGRNDGRPGEPRADLRPVVRPDLPRDARGTVEGRQDVGRPDRVDRADRSDRPDRVDRGDRPDRRREPDRFDGARPETPRIGAPPAGQRPIGAPAPIGIAAPPIGAAAPPIGVAAPPIGRAAAPLAPVPRLEQPVGTVRQPQPVAPPQAPNVQAPPTPERSRALEERRDGLREPRERSR